MRKLSGKLVKVFLPVLSGLLIPVLYDRIDLLLNPLDPYKDGNGAIHGEWVFNDILFPTIIVVLFLVQWLIILPLWSKMILKFRNVLLSSIGAGVVFSVIAGILLGYIFWAKQFGLRDLGISILILSSIVTVYSVSNVFTLYFLDKSYISHLKSHKLHVN